MELFIFLAIIPVFSILLLFIPNTNHHRKLQSNKLIADNLTVFLSPILITQLLTLINGGELGNKKNGGGVVLWL